MTSKTAAILEALTDEIEGVLAERLPEIIRAIEEDGEQSEASPFGEMLIAYSLAGWRVTRTCARSGIGVEDLAATFKRMVAVATDVAVDADIESLVAEASQSPRQ